MKTTHPVIIGIDTHKASHVAVAIDTQGTRLATLSIPTNPKGYLELERWSQSLGKVQAFGIEGTGSYGAGLSRSLPPTATMSLRSRVQIGNCDTRRARQIVWTRKVPHVPFFLGKLRHDRRHRRGHQK
jgi:hypothetical protein